jgi:glycosyltransferase involved in cell wall biosynthesis
VRRVVHLTSVHPQPDTRILVKQCRTLAAAGYEVTLVAPVARDEVADGVAIRAVRPARGRVDRVTRTIADVYRTARSLDADLYHFHDPELLGVGVRLHRLGKRVVYDVHEDVPSDILSKDWIAPALRSSISKAFDRLERAGASRLDAVVTVSPDTTERFAGTGVRAITVHNYPILAAPEIPDAPWSERERTVCYVGALTAIRGTLEMIDAAELAGVKLLLAGTFGGRGHRDDAMARSGWRCVEELGQMTQSQLPAVFARARAGLVLVHPEPNHMEMHTRSTKLFEYMAAGLPVIASDFPQWRAFVHEHGCGVCVDPLDRAAIAAAIRRFVDDPDESERMGVRGREAVRRVYNWEPEARKLLDLYANLLGEPPRR